MTDSAKIGIDVVAGIIPGQPMEEYTRRWFVSSTEWQVATEAVDDNAQLHLLTDVAGKANANATYLMLQPDRLNWVKTEWIWF
jgi:hypothetical protein